MNLAASPAVPRFHFSGHETFPFRYTWLSKGVQTLETQPDLFNREDAIVNLGVGKNMVQSIRHWCEALGLIRTLGKGNGHEPTPLGKKLLGSRGWDPYLEDVGTLWLLHWLLVSNVELASTWHLAFTRWSPHAFSPDELVRWVSTMVPEGSRASTNSLRRDAEVFLRTYVAKTSDRTGPIEDSFDCPLVELGLIQDLGKSTYRFVRGLKPSLPDAIFNFALVDFWGRWGGEQKTLSFETSLHGFGSPGAVFKLSENALCERLERLPSQSGISFDETAGMRQLLLRKELSSLNSYALLERYYEKS